MGGQWHRWLLALIAVFTMARALGAADDGDSGEAIVFAVVALATAVMAGALWSETILRGPLRRRR
jgi:hypothetical protein